VNLNIEIGNVWYRNNTTELSSGLIVVYVRYRSVGKPPASGILLRGPLQEARQATAVFHCFHILTVSKKLSLFKECSCGRFPLL
jgi:hypothetical protein